MTSQILDNSANLYLRTLQGFVVGYIASWYSCTIRLPAETETEMPLHPRKTLDEYSVRVLLDSAPCPPSRDWFMLLAGVMAAAYMWEAA